MVLEYWLSITLFAISSSITPGPNNIMVMTSGLNFGVRKSLPLLIGICIGFTIMLLLVGLGFGQIFQRWPQLELVVKILGTSYLLYLAWLISQMSEVGTAKAQPQPLSFFSGALFQWVNAKAWVVAIGAISAFTTADNGFVIQNLTIAATFFIVSFPCVGVWLMFGSMLRKLLTKPRNLRLFNLSMASLLVVSALPVIRDIVTSFIAR